MWRGEVNGIFTPPHPPSPAAAPLSSSVVTAELERRRRGCTPRGGPNRLPFAAASPPASLAVPGALFGSNPGLKLPAVAGSRIRVLLQCPEDMRERE